jgi:hypothetical protein
MEEASQSITTALARQNPETMLRADVVAQELNAARQQDRGIAGDAAVQRCRAGEAHLVQGMHKRAEVGVAVPGQQSVRIGQVSAPRLSSVQANADFEHPSGVMAHGLEDPGSFVEADDGIQDALRAQLATAEELGAGLLRAALVP